MLTGKSIRKAFEKEFGKLDAIAIMVAATSHADPPRKRGIGLFQWALMICIGFDCITKQRFYHGIGTHPSVIKSWVKKYARLDKYNGPCDIATAFCGGYKKWMPDKK